MSLNDVCCYVPAWFGVVATLLLGMLTYECSGNANAATIACVIMSMIPAHIMRSVGGGYDNESIAVTAMLLTFYLWCRSLRSDKSWPIGLLAGLAYIYMVAAWGGYIFVLNMVGFSAIMLVFIGRFSPKLHHSYSLFYAIGTLGAIQIPVVGLTPLRSLEQLGPMGVFFILQLLYICEIQRKRYNMNSSQLFKYRLKVFAAAGCAGALVFAALYPTGYFGPLSSRVRGLFVQHTRTGNPLVDSVAEHQPASPRAYYQYLYSTCYLAPMGFLFSFQEVTDAKIFLLLYALVAYFFSAKMVRLIILLGPIASSLSGVALAKVLEWAYDQFFAKKVPKKKGEPSELSWVTPEIEKLFTTTSEAYRKQSLLRKAGALFAIVTIAYRSFEFGEYSHKMAQAMSNPSIMFNAQTRTGTLGKITGNMHWHEADTLILQVRKF